MIAAVTVQDDDAVAVTVNFKLKAAGTRRGHAATQPREVTAPICCTATILGRLSSSSRRFSRLSTTIHLGPEIRDIPALMQGFSGL